MTVKKNKNILNYFIVAVFLLSKQPSRTAKMVSAGTWYFYGQAGSVAVMGLITASYNC
jgi:hypothetical protein